RVYGKVDDRVDLVRAQRVERRAVLRWQLARRAKLQGIGALKAIPTARCERQLRIRPEELRCAAQAQASSMWSKIGHSRDAQRFRQRAAHEHLVRVVEDKRGQPL